MKGWGWGWGRGRGRAFRRGRGGGPGYAEPGIGSVESRPGEPLAGPVPEGRSGEAGGSTDTDADDAADADAVADADAATGAGPDAGPAPAVVSVILVVVVLGLSFEPGVVLPRPAAVPMLLLQLATCLPSARRLRGAWTLGAQVLLTPWSGLPGFLGASVLLVVEGRVRWALFTAVVLAAGPLAPGDGSAHSVLNSVGNALAHGLIIYALTRLTDLYTELRATRGALAEALVTAERERAGRSLDAVLGTALAEIARLAGQGTHTARRLVTVARAASERVRTAAPAQSAGAAAALPGALAPRLVWPIVVATHLEYLIVGTAFLLGAGMPGGRVVTYAAVLGAVVALQAYHSLPRPPGTRPPYVAWTLGAQLILALGMLAAPDGPYPQLVGFAAASVLIVLPGRTAWPAAGAMTVLAGVATLLRANRSSAGINGRILCLAAGLRPGRRCHGRSAGQRRPRTARGGRGPTAGGPLMRAMSAATLSGSFRGLIGPGLRDGGASPETACTACSPTADVM
ncbi:hypothetical protein [Streptomyces erythrochromogenes]|uniref:hypothetical protein n=1 Tax=Streptomyces erythrochromogenes TaxID=285574 RepID=UPI0036C9C815